MLLSRMSFAALFATVVLVLLQGTAGQCVVTAAGPVAIEGAPTLSTQFNSPYMAVTDGQGGLWISGERLSGDDDVPAGNKLKVPNVNTFSPG